MSRNAAIVSGVLLILLVTVMSGGGFLLEQTLSRAAGFIDDPSVAALQRAGHGHAGVLLVLALWAQLAIDKLQISAAVEWILRLAFPVAAALMSGGFFLSAATAAVGGSEPSLVLRGGALVLGLSLLTVGGLLLTRRRS